MPFVSYIFLCNAHLVHLCRCHTKYNTDSLIEHCGGVVVGGHSLVGGLAIENGALERLVRLNGVVVGLRVERFKNQ